MKKIIALRLALLVMAFVACTKEPESESTDPRVETAVLRVNVSGLGEVAAGEDGGAPVFDEEYPIQSIFMNVEKGTQVQISTRPQEDYLFVKWTKDGEYYSEDTDITVTVDADTEYIAVYGMSSGYDGPSVENIADAKTMADVLALPCYAQSTAGNHFGFVFEHHGTVYRAVSNITSETMQAIFDLDFEDPEYDKKFCDIVAPLAIDRLDDFYLMVPSQEELDKYVGKTFGNLFDEGWTYSSYNLEDKEFGMEKGLFTYYVGFEGEIDSNEGVSDESIRSLVVTSVRHDGIGNILSDLED